MIVTAHIKFGLHSAFLDSFFTAEDERLPGESIEDGVLRVRKQLEVAVDRLKKEHESMRGIQDESQHFHGLGPIPENQKPSPIINIQHEKTDGEDPLLLIQNAPTLEVLKTFKVIASSDPTKLLYDAYNQRVKQLSKL